MHLKVTAELSSPLAGDAPYLDAILEYQMALLEGRCMAITRADPAPIAGEVHIPILRGTFGRVDKIPRCSAPILAPENVRHEHFAKRIAVEHADVLAEDKRLVVATGNSWTKAYRLPLKISNVDRIVWFIGGNDSDRNGKRSSRRMILSVLRRVYSVGKKRSQGYGRVSKWTAEECEHDLSWFAKTEQGTLLMRALPFCDSLPSDLIGYRRDFGGCIPPLWHPDRYMEIVTPC